MSSLSSARNRRVSICASVALSVIANVIAEKNIDIRHAKISTLGEKIDDIFYLTTPSGEAITDQATLDALAEGLVQALEAKKAA